MTIQAERYFAEPNHIRMAWAIEAGDTENQATQSSFPAERFNGAAVAFP